MHQRDRLSRRHPPLGERRDEAPRVPSPGERFSLDDRGRRRVRSQPCQSGLLLGSQVQRPSKADAFVGVLDVLRVERVDDRCRESGEEEARNDDRRKPA